MSCPPTSHTVKLMFLYSTVSTLKPVHTHTHKGVRRDERGGGGGVRKQATGRVNERERGAGKGEDELEVGKMELWVTHYIPPPIYLGQHPHTQ